MRSNKGAAATQRFVWRKLSPAKWEDVWQERLGWLGQRLVMILLTGYKTLRIEAHQLTRREADALVREFRGEIRPAKPFTAQDLQPKPRPALKIGRELVVVGDEKEWRRYAAGSVPALLIPASMAFGTGDHATTATCLRLLSTFANRLRSDPWEALDLGTGTGILALAARVFGARKVDAADYDATAVQVARANAKLNGVKGVNVKRFDVLKWRPERKWEVVIANLYGPILMEAARQIAGAVARGGTLILSGTLREQADDVASAFRSRGFEFERIVRKGKWVTMLGVPKGRGR